MDHRHGLSSQESRDPFGYALAALNRLAQSDLLDRVGLRKQAERAVLTVSRTGFRGLAAATRATTSSRAFARRGHDSVGVRAPATSERGVFDLAPTEDEQMLLDLVGAFAAEVLRPAAAEANETCAAPESVLKASLEIGLPILGVPESLGGISEERSAMAGTLVAEALSHGDLGLAVATLAPGSVATALSLWGTDEQQQTYLPAFTGDDVPAAALALMEPSVLFEVLDPATSATRDGDGYLLDGTKSLVARGEQSELFVVGAALEGSPVLFLVESGTPGLAVEAEPAMGVRAASLSRLSLTGVRVPGAALLGATDSSTYTECVRLSRLAWCALAVGTAQAVLDYVTPYVKERRAFGEPIAHRQSVAFKVADMAIEVQAMRLLTYRAASRAARGEDVARDVALARRLCADKGMQIGLDGVQLLGGPGFVKEHPVERWYRDLRAIALMEGAVLV